MTKNDSDKQKLLKRVAFDIISLSRNSLFISLRFLDLALFQFALQEEEEITTLASEGTTIYYNPKHLVRQYKSEKAAIGREILHLVLHFVFKHPFIEKKINREYWDLATDIAIEKVINDLHLQQVDTDRAKQQEEYLEQLALEVTPITAEKVYRYLQNRQMTKDEIASLAELFFQDDHAMWYVQADEDIEAVDQPPSDQPLPNEEKASSEKDNKTQEQEEKRSTTNSAIRA